MAKKDKKDKLEEVIEEAKEEGVEVEVIKEESESEPEPSGHVFEAPRKRR